MASPQFRLPSPSSERSPLLPFRDPPGSRDPSANRLSKSEFAPGPSSSLVGSTQGPNAEHLRFFRRALGIHSGAAASSGAGDLERSHTAPSTGIYASILREHAIKKWQRRILTATIYACHIAQIIIGAVLTALGPSSAIHAVSITILGATNTTVAGIMALVKGWVEETEALMEAGIIGGDREEASRLVAEGYRRYRAVMTEGKALEGMGLRSSDDHRVADSWRRSWDSAIGRMRRQT
ncbi:hypothetical protein BN1723_002916 [Verticillium longisporum]|uniref:SMODS and SLOG-associating 2TM effector domain-containing protein n=1 Tax=Verticillium longisporum TaxID=100787 RepID=A0A0G4LLB3_VERLO|nr:hypothetical protein HYQ44_011392 [Verticillium longisporum]CRK22480.1 hypothetical protein BN1723_002916 [Verticillium longisporum]